MKYNPLYAFAAVGLILLIPGLTLAQQTPVFKPLVGIPGIDPTAGFNQYINALYALSISIAGLLAVIKIIIAGVKYMLTDVVTGKSDAKSDIQGALFGLLIVISAVVVLNLINPQLTQSKLFLTQVDKAPGAGNANSVVRTTAPTGSVVNADGSQNEGVTRMACQARAGQGETAVFTVVSNRGSVEYGTCVVSPVQPNNSNSATFVPTLLWSATGIPRNICEQNAQARNGEARYTDNIQKCEVWSKPTPTSQNSAGPQ